MACEFSGSVRSRLRERGIDAWSCDIIDSEDGSEYHIKGDALEAMRSRHWDAVIAFPPCTHLAVSGARHFAQKRADGRQQAGIDFFLAFTECDARFVAIENPVSIMSTHYRKPDQIIQPWMFGHGETKATCLWLKGFPKLKPTRVVEGRDCRILRLAGNPKERSRTYSGIADAISEQWGDILVNLDASAVSGNE